MKTVTNDTFTSNTDLVSRRFGLSRRIKNACRDRMPGRLINKLDRAAIGVYDLYRHFIHQRGRTDELETEEEPEEETV